MKITFLCMLILAAPSGLFEYDYVGYGRASQYAEGVMERVVRYRQRIDQLPDNLERYDGFVAVRDCRDIGKEYLLFYEGRGYLVLAADCASKSDHQSEVDLRSGYEWMIDGNILVEVDYKLAKEVDKVGRIFHILLFERIPRRRHREV